MTVDSKFLILLSLTLLVDLSNIIVNIFLVVALRKLKKLRTLSYRLILLMSISDICVGCSALVSHTSDALCITKRICAPKFQLCASLMASFFLYFAGRFTLIIAIDRFIRMRYLIRYDRIMTNLRATLLIAASALVGVVTSIMRYGPLSKSVQHYFFVGLTLFHTIGVMLGLVLYFWAFRSLKTKVDNLHVASKIGKEAGPVENINAVDENRAGHNNITGGCSCGSPINKAVHPWNVRIRSASELKYGSECPDTSSNDPVDGPWVNSLNDGLGNKFNGNTLNTCLEMDHCKNPPKECLTKIYGATRSHSIPASYLCNKASDIPWEDIASNDQIVDPCGIARNCFSKTFSTSISHKGIDGDKEKSNRASSFGRLNALHCHDHLKATTSEISKSLEMRLETKSSTEEETRNTSPHTHEKINDRQGLKCANEQQCIRDADDLQQQGRDARVAKTLSKFRRRPDQEFAKAVLLINVAIVFCYFPGLILYYFGLLPGIRYEKYAYAQEWGLLLSYMNSTLNAVIFIGCSSELRFYAKSLFVRNSDSV